jgi:formiminoglutamase
MFSTRQLRQEFRLRLITAFLQTLLFCFLPSYFKVRKLIALDVAEVNPEFDIAERTARLAASLVNEWFMIS